MMCTVLFIAGVIEVVLNSGRHIDAVNLAFAFELTKQFPPVELLKSYLTEAKRSSSQVMHLLLFRLVFPCLKQMHSLLFYFRSMKHLRTC